MLSLNVPPSMNLLKLALCLSIPVIKQTLHQMQPWSHVLKRNRVPNGTCM